MSGGEAPRRWAIFLEKIAILMSFGSHFLEPLEATKFLRFESQLKKLNCSSLSFTY